MTAGKERNLNFDEAVDRTHTDCLKYDFALRRGRPADVLPLWVADMDFRTSSRIVDAIKERADHGIFGYTETGESYFDPLSAWLSRRHGYQVKPEWLIKTPGVVFALATAVKAFTKEGDAVLIQQPVYYPFSEVIADNRRVVVSSDLVLTPKGRYEIDFDDLESKIRKFSIKLFLLCSPHNPVGRVWTRQELTRIGQICLKNDVILVSDEIHEDFVYEGYQHLPFAAVSSEFEQIAVTCTSPSKTFNLAGLQVSNIFIANRDLRRKFRAQVSASGYSQLNTLGLVACEAAYRYGEEYLEALLKYLKGNLDFLRSYLARHLPQVKLIEPEGTYLVWLDFRELSLSDQELEDLLVKKARLWLDNGLLFGRAGAGFQRLNLATSRSVLRKALERLKGAFLEDAETRKGAL